MLTVKSFLFCSNVLQMRRKTWGGRLELFAKLDIMPINSLEDIEDIQLFVFSTNMLNQLSLLFQHIIMETISFGSVISLKYFFMETTQEDNSCVDFSSVEFFHGFNI